METEDGKVIRMTQYEKCSVANGGFEDGKGAPAKEWMQLLRAGKGNK